MAVPLPPIPLPYTLLLTYLEPLMALNGAALCYLHPASYLSTFSATLPYTPSSQLIYEQLGATYIFLAFVEAVVLRCTGDVGVWRAVVCGLLVSDVLHAVAGWRVMRGEENLRVVRWRPVDWVAVVSLAVPAGVRVAFLCGVGMARVEG